MEVYMAPILGAVARFGGKFIAKQVLGGGLTKALGKGGSSFLKNGGEQALKAGAGVFKKAGLEAVKTAIKKGDFNILKDAFKTFMQKGGKNAIGNGLTDFINNGGAGGLAKFMSKSAFGFEIPGIGSLAEKHKDKLLSSALDVLTPGI
jgi:hypothetical protein